MEQKTNGIIPKKILDVLKKQHYAICSNTCGVQICRWNKKSLLNEGSCYKEKFYGIKSHECCQMSPCVMWCHNRCKHCWRAIEYNLGKKLDKKDVEKPEKIIKDCIEAQRKLLSGFKGNKKINMKKFIDAQTPKHFAISLSGEPTIYPYLAELIKNLREQGKTTFIVTNGLNPKRILELEKKNALPTQLYISFNTFNKKMYEEWHNPLEKNAWEKYNKSLEIMKKLGKKKKTRTVLRMTLVRNMNMKDNQAKDYAKLILKASPDFVEAKGYMSVGYARQRLGYEMMPTHEEIKRFAKLLVKELKSSGYKILDEKVESRIVLLGKDKKRMKIKKSEI
jgi:tRNA wybutosine-synthesizing protein 1